MHLNGMNVVRFCGVHRHYFELAATVPHPDRSGSLRARGARTHLVADHRGHMETGAWLAWIWLLYAGLILIAMGSGNQSESVLPSSDWPLAAKVFSNARL